jgi:hypothetical protein
VNTGEFGSPSHGAAALEMNSGGRRAGVLPSRILSRPIGHLRPLLEENGSGRIF